MKTVKSVLFTLVAIILCSSGLTVRRNASAKVQQPVLSEAERIRQVVEKYVEFSRAGKLKDLDDITTSIPKFALKKPPGSPGEQRKDGITRVVPRTNNNPNDFDWIRKSLPDLFLNSQYRIVKSGELVIEKDLAKLPINIGNDEIIVALPWVFMLTQEADGSWKIYDIKSPAYAEDYRP